VSSSDDLLDQFEQVDVRGCHEPSSAVLVHIPAPAVKVRLDEVLPVQPLQFIKLDVQGYELAALSGMQQLLGASPDVRVLFEFWPAGLQAANASPELLFKFFNERDFLIYELENGQALKRDMPATLVNKLGVKGYVNLLASRTLLPTR